jgi:hypothetical protein
MTFAVDTKGSRFDRCAFSGSDLTSIHIPSSVEVIYDGCFSEDESLASVTRDPSAKPDPLLSGLLAAVRLEWGLSRDL